MQSQDQGQQLDLGQRRMNWSMEMQSQEQYERRWVKEVSGSEQVIRLFRSTRTISPLNRQL